MISTVRLAISFGIFCSCCQASITVWPVTPVCERDNVTLVCRTTLNVSVVWGVTRNLTGTPMYFYIFSIEGIVRELADRFYVRLPPVDGFYNLTIVNLTINDTGAYRCVEEAGIGTDSKIIQLQVTDLQNCSRDQQTTDSATDNEILAADQKCIAIVIPIVWIVVLIAVVVGLYMRYIGRRKKRGGNNSTTSVVPSSTSSGEDANLLRPNERQTANNAAS